MSLSTDLRQRVLLLLNKLADRDTLPLAAAELESIARALPRDSFAPFLGCLSAVDSADKPPVRRHCVRLVGLLADAHGDSLSPYLSKMLSAVLRRLRDSDSSVQSACAASVSAMASKITKPPFSSFLKPLVDAVLHEQDHNSQIGSALCLAAAIDAVPDPEPAQLQKVLPKLLTLVTKDCFKAKAALLSVIGSVARAGGAKNHSMLSGLISCLVNFLHSEDWAARKAAAEAMSGLAVAERGTLAEFRASCLASLENRRFDKVKIVRDTMNSTLKVWKDVPEVVSPQLQYRSSSVDGVVTRSAPLCDKLEASQPKKKYSTSRSLSSDKSFAITTPRRIPSMNCGKKPKETSFSKQESQMVCADALEDGCVGLRHRGADRRNSILKLETGRALFRQNFDEKVHKFGSRVVPFYDSDVVQCDDQQDLDVNLKEAEDLNLICKQLVQIENQQSNLLELLQRFMGSSQSGIDQLENRVNGLEKALDEISQDFAVSTGKILNTESAQNSCCRLPGAEFWSPKFWRRVESLNPYSSFYFSKRNQSPSTTLITSGMQRIDSPLQNDRMNTRANLEHCSPKNVKMSSDGEMLKLCLVDGLDGTSLANSVASANISCGSLTQLGS